MDMQCQWFVWEYLCHLLPLGFIREDIDESKNGLAAFDVRDLIIGSGVVE